MRFVLFVLGVAMIIAGLQGCAHVQPQGPSPLDRCHKAIVDEREEHRQAEIEYRRLLDRCESELGVVEGRLAETEPLPCYPCLGVQDDCQRGVPRP